MADNLSHNASPYIPKIWIQQICLIGRRAGSVLALLFEGKSLNTYMVHDQHFIESVWLASFITVANAHLCQYHQSYDRLGDRIRLSGQALEGTVICTSQKANSR